MGVENSPLDRPWLLANDEINSASKLKQEFCQQASQSFNLLIAFRSSTIAILLIFNFEHYTPVYTKRPLF